MTSVMMIDAAAGVEIETVLVDGDDGVVGSVGSGEVAGGGAVTGAVAAGLAAVGDDAAIP